MNLKKQKDSNKTARNIIIVSIIIVLFVLSISNSIKKEENKTQNTQGLIINGIDYSNESQTNCTDLEAYYKTQNITLSCSEGIHPSCICSPEDLKNAPFTFVIVRLNLTNTTLAYLDCKDGKQYALNESSYCIINYNKTKSQISNKASPLQNVSAGVVVGNLKWTLLSSFQESSAGSEYYESSPNGIFLVLDMTVENVANEAKTISPTMIKLVDSQGKIYEPDSYNLAYGEFALNYEEINPDISKSGYIIFDVPKGKIFTKIKILEEKNSLTEDTYQEFSITIKT